MEPLKIEHLVSGKDSIRLWQLIVPKIRWTEWLIIRPDWLASNIRPGMVATDLLLTEKIPGIDAFTALQAYNQLVGGENPGAGTPQFQTVRTMAFLVSSPAKEETLVSLMQGFLMPEFAPKSVKLAHHIIFNTTEVLE
jgi:hypothetical protein